MSYAEAPGAHRCRFRWCRGPGLSQRMRAGAVVATLLLASSGAQAAGAAAGSVIRGARDYRDAGEGAHGGAVLGAIAGAVIGKRQRDESEDDEVFTEYFRALDACMSGRGNSPALAEETG